MTPEYIEHLAELADPDNLWRRLPDNELAALPDLTLEQSAQRDTGLALRHYATLLRRARSNGEAGS